MPEQFDKEVLLLLIIFTAEKDILCLFVAVEQLEKVSTCELNHSQNFWQIRKIRWHSVLTYPGSSS